MNKENWLWIINFEELYQVSDQGRVRSFNKNKNGKIMWHNKNQKGYNIVELRKNGKRYCRQVHRLVMETFKGESELQVNHKDGNKDNNSLENLEYLTAKENVHHAWKTGLCKVKKGEENHASILKERDVIEIKHMLNLNIRPIKIAKVYEVDETTISNINIGKTWRNIKV